MFRIFKTETYEEMVNALDNSEIKRINKFEESLKINPFSGRPLSYEFLREKKFSGKRLMFLIYEEFQIVYLVCIADKKTQQEEINIIKANIDYYKEELKNKLKFL